MNISDGEIRFLKTLNAIAALSETELTRDQIELYDKSLASFGYDLVVQALDEILLEQRPRQPMPSIAEVIRHLDKQREVSDKAQANACVQNLFRCVSRHGYTWPETYRYDDPEADSFDAHINNQCGELGSEVVRLSGGWIRFCEDANSNFEAMTAMRAQFRDIALGVLERSRRGVGVKEMPSLPTGDSIHPKVKELLGSVKFLGGKL